MLTLTSINIIEYYKNFHVRRIEIGDSPVCLCVCLFIYTNMYLYRHLCIRMSLYLYLPLFRLPSFVLVNNLELPRILTNDIHVEKTLKH